MSENSVNIMNKFSILGSHIEKMVKKIFATRATEKIQKRPSLDKDKNCPDFSVKVKLHLTLKPVMMRKTVDYKELMLEKRNVSSHGPEDLTTTDKCLENLLARSKCVFTQSSFQEIYYNSNIKNEKPLRFFIVNELVTSERDYLANLELICDDFRNTLKSSYQNSDTAVIDYYLNFDNLLNIYNLSKNLLHELECRIKTNDSPAKISDIFLSKSVNFLSYIEYLINLTTMLKQFDTLCENNPRFRKLVAMFETLSKCRKLKVKHFLLKPMQRLPQYKMLLTDYLKQLTEDSDDYRNTEETLKFISDTLNHANKIV